MSTATALPSTVKAGVVTGEALWDLLQHAKTNGYAIPAVNCVTSCSISSCLEAAKINKGPIIVQFSRGGGQFYAGKAAENPNDAACIAGTVAVSRPPSRPSPADAGSHEGTAARRRRGWAHATASEAARGAARSLRLAGAPRLDTGPRACLLASSRHTPAPAPPQGALHTRTVAELYGVPVILHTDHCMRSWLPWFDGLLDANEAYFKQHGEPLFSSHMLDLSEEPLEENIATCVEYLTRMAKSNVLLEMELGVTGGEEDGVDNTDVDSSKLYTQPEEVYEVYKALNAVEGGRFTVAAAFGNVHGVYAPGNVKLTPEILHNTQKYITEQTGAEDGKPVCFVFHGGSGSSREDIRYAIEAGTVKMNIDTDTQWAFWDGMREYEAKFHDYLQGQVWADQRLSQPSVPPRPPSPRPPSRIPWHTRAPPPRGRLATPSRRPSPTRSTTTRACRCARARRRWPSAWARPWRISTASTSCKATSCRPSLRVVRLAAAAREACATA